VTIPDQVYLKHSQELWKKQYLGFKIPDNPYFPFPYGMAPAAPVF